MSKIDDNKEATNLLKNINYSMENKLRAMYNMGYKDGEKDMLEDLDSAKSFMRTLIENAKIDKCNCDDCEELIALRGELVKARKEHEECIKNAIRKGYSKYTVNDIFGILRSEYESLEKQIELNETDKNPFWEQWEATNAFCGSCKFCQEYQTDRPSFYRHQKLLQKTKKCSKSGNLVYDSKTACSLWEAQND